ncbi:MAG: hypothetical protein IRY99_01175 [Isosphaeraceae bacterium]|nr:hypothetical protein [Isosphaeraceae bacterium]
MEPEAKYRRVEGVQIYLRERKNDRPSLLDANDQDHDAIRRLADRLHRRGYGVKRQESRRAGRVYYRFEAQWVGPGDPPDDPLGG